VGKYLLISKLFFVPLYRPTSQITFETAVLLACNTGVMAPPPVAKGMGCILSLAWAALAFQYNNISTYEENRNESVNGRSGGAGSVGTANAGNFARNCGNCRNRHSGRGLGPTLHHAHSLDPGRI